MLGPRKNNSDISLEPFFGQSSREVGLNKLLETITVRPNTPTIITPVTVNTDNWTAIVTGLSNVLSWKFQERTGSKQFRYAYVAAPGTDYMTSYGPLIRQTELTALYIQRVNASDTLVIEGEYWTLT